MKTFFALALSILSLPAFALDGTLDVKSGSLRVMREDGMKVSFYPGKYKAQVSFDRDKAYLMVERKDVRTDAVVKFPAGAQVPENGAVRIDGFATGQTFSMAGEISTVRDRTETERGFEGCTYSRRDWICHGWGHHRECGWETIVINGSREVEFHYETKTVNLSLKLDSRNGGDSSFGGRSVSRKKEYTFVGECY